MYYAFWYCLVARVDRGNQRLLFWDLGGQEDLQTLWDKVLMMSTVISIDILLILQYYAECHGIVYVVDSCDAERLATSAQTFSKAAGFYYEFTIVIIAFRKSYYRSKVVRCSLTDFSKQGGQTS